MILTPIEQQKELDYQTISKDDIKESETGAQFAILSRRIRVPTISDYHFELSNNEVQHMKKLSKGESFNISRMDFQFTNGFQNDQCFQIMYFYTALNKNITTSDVEPPEEKITPSVKIYGTADGEQPGKWEGYLDGVNHGKNIFTYQLQQPSITALVNQMNNDLQHYYLDGNGIHAIVDITPILKWEIKGNNIVLTSGYNSNQTLMEGYNAVNSSQRITNIHLDIEGVQQNPSIRITNAYYVNKLLGIVPDKAILNDSIQHATLQDNITYKVYYLNTEGTRYLSDFPTSDVYFEQQPIFIDTSSKNIQEWTICLNHTYKDRRVDTVNLIGKHSTRYIFEREYFIPIFKTIYFICPTLQSNEIIFNNDIKDTKKQEYQYLLDYYYQKGGEIIKHGVYNTYYQNYFQTLKKVPVLGYYINDLSFNNYGSFQNNFQFTFNNTEQSFNLENLKKFNIQLVDENGFPIPYFQDFQIFVQLDEAIDQKQKQSSNINRTLIDAINQ